MDKVGMKMEILDSIREEEKRAEELKQNARLESDRMLDDAESEARVKVSEMVASARTEADALLQKASEEAAAQKQKRLDESVRADKELVGEAETRMGAAVDFILRQILPGKGA